MTPTTGAELAAIQHERWCPQPDDSAAHEFTGNRGDTVRQCLACRRFRVTARNTPAPTPPRVAPGPTPRARYVVACADCGTLTPTRSRRPVVAYCAACEAARVRVRHERDATPWRGGTQTRATH